jgi:hypothetical protein
VQRKQKAKSREIKLLDEKIQHQKKSGKEYREV